MGTRNRKGIEYYLGLSYPFAVTADPDGGYVITFPDLPGCMTQVDNAEEIGLAAEEARHLWIRTEYEADDDLPLPSYPQDYSGRFNVRLPRSLHRSLAATAENEGVSLNQLVVFLLSQRRVEPAAPKADKVRRNVRGRSPRSRTPA